VAAAFFELPRELLYLNLVEQLSLPAWGFRRFSITLA